MADSNTETSRPPECAPTAAPRRRAWSNPLLAALRLSTFVVGSLVLLGCYFAGRLGARGRAARLAVSPRWTHRWARFSAGVMGYRVEIVGEPPPPGSYLAPNHVGYVDILIVAAAAPTFFVAKAEVASWPLFGLLAGSSDHIFVTRRRSKGMRDTSAEIAERLHAGQNVCTFLEGTSSGGTSVLPLHSSFLQPAVEAGARIVPIASRWLPTRPGIDPAEDIAYWKDHRMAPHLWRHAGLRGLRVKVAIGRPIESAGRDRKTLALEVHAEIARLLQSLAES